MNRDEAIKMLTAPGQPFEMQLEHVRGIEMRVHKQRMGSLRELAVLAAGHADKECMIFGARRLSYREFFERANAVSDALITRFAVARGDRVAILAANCPEWGMAFWGTLNAGAVVVGVNGWAKADEILFFLGDSGARVLVADRKRFERIADRLDELPSLEHVVLFDDEQELEAGRHAFSTLTAEPTAAFPTVEIDEDDPAVIFYTSGTTGRPKGAVASHRAWLAAAQHLIGMLTARSLAEAGMAATQPEEQTVVLSSMPFFHVGGGHATLVLGMAGGQKIVLTEGRFDPEQVMTLIQREKVTSFGGVPTMVWRVCQHPDRQRYDLTSVTAINSGGAPWGAELRKRIAETFVNVPKERTVNVYGLTETSTAVLIASGDETVGRPGTVGKPELTLDLRVVDDDGNDAPAGAPGEVWIRGPFVFPGYWNRPDANAEVLKDGWLITGDIGFVDDEGYLTISDRKKEMIIRGGENVYCGEIEERLLAHPDVLDAAVLGIAHPDLGEEVKAFVYIRPKAKLSEGDLKGWVAETLANFKVPSIVELRTEALPRNPNGKLIKSALRGDGESVFAELF